MAAIIPFLERQDDPAETKILSAELALPAKVAAEAGTVETMAARVGARVIARGTFGDLATEGLTAEALNQTHAELVNTAWIRKVVEDQLVGQTYTIEREGRHTRIVLAKEIGPSPAWNPPANPENRRFKVLSWTSKMAAPSFSLPAGPLEAGGACPGATAGQSIVPVDALLPAARRVRAVTGEPVRLQQAICNFCLAGDTRVLVRDRGFMRLDELGDGEFDVWSGLQWRRTKLVTQGVREVVTLRTTWGHEITLTPDHKVLTDDGMVEVQELELGDALQVQLPPAGSTGFAESALLPPLDLGPQYRTAVATSYPKHWSRDVGYVLGAILGDGCIHYREHPTVAITGARADREILDRVSAAVRSWCDTESDVVLGPKLATAQWRVKSLVQFFDSLGLDKRPEASARRAPASIWTASRDGVRGFLQGLFDTDGSVSVGTSKTEVSLASVSEGLLRDVQQLLGAFGVRSNICPYKTSNRAREAEGHHALYKLSIGSVESLLAFMAHVGFQLARKRTKLADALLAMEHVEGRETHPRVASITRLRAHVPVFDLLNVGDERQFLANGISVSNCYAEGGQYSTGQVQFAQVLRYVWARQAARDVRFEGNRAVFGPVATAWCRAMIEAIDSAEYRLDGREKKGEDGEPTVVLLPERHAGRFFRIHDSGDFFSKQYLAMWKAVTNALPGIRFWAPTRIWATSWGVDAVNEINGPAEASNLIIRPSAYHVQEAPVPRAKLGQGWSSGSSAIHKDVKQWARAAQRFDWDCQTYAVDDEKHTCRHAIAPDGKTGCRACWERTDLRINYTLH